MELFICLLFIALFIDIFLNNLLIGILPYCIYIIPTRPKVTSPKLTFDFRMKSKKFLCGDAFNRLNYLLYRHHGHTLYQEMNMVVIRSFFNKKYFISAFNIFTYLYQTPFNRLRQNSFEEFFWLNFGLVLNIDSIIFIHNENPIHFIIDTAPIFLGIAFGVSGFYQERGKILNRSLRHGLHRGTQRIDIINCKSLPLCYSV